jgi:hypothetical protein
MVASASGYSGPSSSAGAVGIPGYAIMGMGCGCVSGPGIVVNRSAISVGLTSGSCDQSSSNSNPWLGTLGGEIDMLEADEFEGLDEILSELEPNPCEFTMLKPSDESEESGQPVVLTGCGQVAGGRGRVVGVIG